MTPATPRRSLSGAAPVPPEIAPLYPFDGRYLDIDGVRMHYLDEGEGDPVLMLHGNPTWSFYYRRLVQALRGGHRCIVPDHIGCGLSDKPDGARYDHSLARRIDDLSRLVDHLRLERTDLIVHDWGGMIGMGWAVRNAERVGRVVVLNSAAFHLPRGRRFPAVLALARSPLLGEFLLRGLSAFSIGANRFCVVNGRMPRDVAKGYSLPYGNWADRVAVHRFVQDIPLRPAHRSYRSVTDVAERLVSLRGRPLLICWGMRDFIFDEPFLAEWIERFPDAAVHRFPNAGHYVLEDAYEDIEPLVRGFLQPGVPLDRSANGGGAR